MSTRQCHWTVLPPEFSRNFIHWRLMLYFVFSLAALWSVPHFSPVTQSCKCRLIFHNYFSSMGILIGTNEWISTVMKEIHSIKENPEIQLLIRHTRLHIFFKLTSPCSFGQCQWSFSRLTIIKPLVYSSMAFLWACECACSSIGLFTWPDVTQCEYWLQNWACPCSSSCYKHQLLRHAGSLLFMAFCHTQGM